VSGKPYLYNPRGLPYSRGAGLIVLYDAEPSHSGMRLGIAAEEPKGRNQPLVTHIVAEPEAHFHPAGGGE
jgi:hypothetical protein